jgi:hypothetical protein
MAATPARAGRDRSREGLAELLLLLGFLGVAVAGAVALFGGEIREAFGAPAPPTAAAPPAAR